MLAGNPSSCSRSSIPSSHPVRPAPKSPLLLPTRFHVVGDPHHLENMREGPKLLAKFVGAHVAALKNKFPIMFSAISGLVPGYMSSSRPCARALPTALPRPLRILVPSASLHANMGPHSLIIGMPCDSGCRKGRAGHRSRI
jgi:hypothetical protein